ncbi:hypothetical protein EVB39_067 [Rhizobium phage RHph_TM3_3_9]|nr:hypothetical protein EVB39_067 [Rhizobium phage RHph_TM3_3_9]QIG68588.1 hypothetical protein EVB66_067 [Rhizobium phage RHph_TM3_3_13]QIG74446.1 hypothetical protein EVC09_066 [Rhizobium phage RHph_TM3_3_10]QXV74560.1 hypothetical protein [Rhizobium phage RHEph19]
MTVVLNWGIEGGAGFTIEAPTVKEVLAAYRGINEIERVQHTGQELDIRAIVRDELTVSAASDSPWNVKVDPEDGTYAQGHPGVPAMVDGWLAWSGSGALEGFPTGVDGNDEIEAKLRNGQTVRYHAYRLRWQHSDDGHDIVAFRKV